MSKKRTIIPNTKVDKNNIGKQGLRFDEIYANNIITDKINNKKVDPDYYLKDNFCIIYPNGGSKEAPANVTINTVYISENPFPGYIVNCKPELLYKEEWGNPYFSYWGSTPATTGVLALQHNNNYISVITAANVLIYLRDPITTLPRSWDKYRGDSNVTTAPCRVLVWKVGKISNDD